MTELHQKGGCDGKAVWQRQNIRNGEGGREAEERMTGSKVGSGWVLGRDGLSSVEGNSPRPIPADARDLCGADCFGPPAPALPCLLLTMGQELGGPDDLAGRGREAEEDEGEMVRKLPTGRR